MSAQAVFKLSAVRRTLRVALAGNPNTGKTSLFNALTGARQHVGNFAGVTVEKKTGACVRGDTAFEIADLPGTYSLSSFSPEERIAQDEILSGRFDVVVATADATNLERGLVILSQILLSEVRVVLCLNMWDEAEAHGKRLDLSLMSALLGIPVIATVGHRGIGTDRLLEAVRRAAHQARVPSKVVLGEEIERSIAAVRAALSDGGEDVPSDGWRAIQLLLDDASVRNATRAFGHGARAIETAQREAKRIAAVAGLDVQTAITESFFGFVDGLLRAVTLQPSRADARAMSDRIDNVLVHRVVGLPIFALVMYGVFYVTFTLGEAPMGWIESGFSTLGDWIGGLWPAGAASPLKSLIVDGVIGGVGGVVVFLPNILLLFLGLAVLEDTGYMARAAFLMDRVMHRFGLHGKSFLPLLTGFGCSIPGIMATRTLENHKDRLVTMLVLPLMSCGARLPIWMLLIPAFFPPVWRAPMLFFIYGFGVLAALLLAMLLRRTVMKSADAPFVMELPPYRLPTLKAVAMKMSERARLYLRKAGTVILAVSVLMWFAVSYPALDASAERQLRDAAAEQGMSEEATEAVVAARTAEHTLAGRLGNWLAPVLAPLGFDWKIACAMVGAFAAKEVFVAQMGVVYAMGKTDERSVPLTEALERDYTPLVGLSMMVFLLIGTPCMATVAVVRRESGAFKWAAFQFFGLTGLAWMLSFAIYQAGRLLGLG